jgi:peptidoglycan/LPS O-acetylase OafA/YrhL
LCSLLNYLLMAAEKYKSLDGLRGLASLLVVTLHFALGFLLFMIGGATTRHTSIDKLVSGTPLFLPFAGDFSVVIFFMLSGFVLSISFFKHKTISVLVSSASRRYFRLMIPAFASVMLAFVVMSLGGKLHLEASSITQSSYLADSWNFSANIFTAVRHGLYDIFATTKWEGGGYNPVLWTMHYELLGSFLVFSFLAFFGNLQRRWIFYAAVFIISLQTYYLAFFIGVALCDLWINNQPFWNKVSPRLAVGMLIAGLILGSIHASIYHTLYLTSGLLMFDAHQMLIFEYSIGATFIMVAIFRLEWLARFFESRPLQYLGKISFSLYLVHFIVIYSLSAFLFNHMYYRLGYFLSFVIMLAISFPVILGLATLGANYVDGPATKWSKSIGAWLISGLKQAKNDDETAMTAP